MRKTTFKDLFHNTDLIVIIDINGKVMYYEDYNDTINMLKNQDAVGHSIFELYPFFERKDFTVFKAMDQKKPILNEYQTFQFDGIAKQTVNSAFPLINDTGVVGGIVISIELPQKKHVSVKEKIAAKYDFSTIITQDPDFLEGMEILKQVAQGDSSVLIYGETGTGKEMIAHSVHNASRRRNAPFIIQNCASIPSSIMESILFGTQKGSFTGAIDKEGIFEAARGGTIFLDEINSMPMDLQSKILRAIENKTIRRVGENEEREVDVRVIAASNEDLLPKIAKGEFRADLYYRLNVFNFVIPPLRKRKNDMVVLTNYYMNYYNNLLNCKITGFSEETLNLFKAYAWPGNVRELKNAIEYALNLKKSGTIGIDDIPSYLLESNFSKEEPQEQNLNKLDENMTLSEQIDAIEKSIIENTFAECRYNIMKTSKRLGVPRQTLYYKLKKYNISK